MDISSLGEFDLIAHLTQGVVSRADVVQGVGDDCAILDLGNDTLLLATCDSQVEGVHFTLSTSRPEQIGRKALVVNLSDIAAMGGEPRYALVSLMLPPHLSLEVLDGVYAGLRQEAQKYGVVIVGGNIAGTGKSEQFIIDITLLGSVEREHVLLRRGAQSGDKLCVTGSLGDSSAGLYTLLHPDQPYPQDALDFVRSRYRVSQPRMREGRLLGQLGPGIVTAMLDISDGLSGDLAHLCERSGVGAQVELSRLPLSNSMHTVAACAALEPFHWALHGGEDYELLFTISPSHEQAVIEAVQRATGTAVTVIGTICDADKGMSLVDTAGHVERLAVQSWDHLSGAH